MKNYALINAENGEVISFTSVHSEIVMPQEAQQGVMYILLDEAVENTTAFIKTKYWKDNEWKTRTERPGESWFWRDYVWVKDTAPLWQTIKIKRNNLLKQTDWTQLPDVTLTEEEMQRWKQYRQTLRDITDIYSSAETEEEINWPTKPV